MIQQGKAWTCIRCPDHPYTWVSYLGRRPKKCPRCKTARFDVPVANPERAEKIRQSWHRRQQPAEG